MKIKFFCRKIFSLFTGKSTFSQIFNQLILKFSKETILVRYKPLRLGIFATGKCNLACSMCLTHSPLIPDNPFKYQGSKDMDLPTFKDILNKFQAALHVSIIGNGEPLLNKDIFEIIRHAKKRKKIVTLFSNGFILDQYLDQLLEHEIDYINISLNAIDETQYQRITGHDPSIFFKCKDNLKKLCVEKARQNKKMTRLTSRIREPNSESSAVLD